MTKKIHSKTSFELCYLRHTYLRKTTYNPTKKEYAVYSHVMNGIAGKTYSVYNKLFHEVGFEYVDIVRIAETSLAPFLQMFSIEVDKEKYSKFVDAFSEKNKILPTEEDVLDKNKAIFTIILKQRMETLVRNCRQKIRNVRGVPMQEFHIFSGAKKVDVTDEVMVIDFRKFGYKRVDMAVFRAIKKKARPENAKHFNFNGLWYITVPTNYKALTETDLNDAGMYNRDTLHNRNPEEVLMISESDKKWEWEYKKFKKIPSETKLDMLKSFIKDNKDSPLFAEELRTAKKVLARLEH